MIRLLKYSEFTKEQNESPNSVYTKYYQHIAMQKFLKPYRDLDGFVAEIGPHSNFLNLRKFEKAKICVIDPYNSAEGAGLPSVPNNLPYPCALFRCLVGEDSQIIPSDLFDLTLSISVLEHIGQRESNYDCNPCVPPPSAQEKPRNRFCRELFRVTALGGLTVHTIDHAARNLTFAQNFIDAGFKLLIHSQPITMDEILFDEDVVRQKRNWVLHDTPMPEEEQRLYGVLFIAFMKAAD